MTVPPLLTAQEFSAGTGGKISAADPRVQPLLDGATAAVRRYCGWHIAPVIEETLVLDGPGGTLLVLPTLRLVEASALSVSGAPVDVSGLEWSGNGEIRFARWPSRFRSVSVTIRHGFDDASDVAQIIQQVVASAVSSPLGATAEAAGTVSVSWAQTAPGVSGGISLLERDLAVLDSYRLPGRA